MRIDGAVERVARERAEVVRKAVRVDAFALDQPGVAERSLLGSAAPVDERDRARALLQMQRDADADGAARRSAYRDTPLRLTPINRTSRTP
jgi:hypothetical protein